jgi:glycosyltransferase involved in cell wall biosynthesis
LGVPVFWHLREIFARGKTAWLLRRIARIGRVRLIANSGATARAFGRPARVVHNGISVEAWRARNACRLRGELGLGEAPVVGIAGVLARWKGQDVFLRAASRLGAEVQFVVIGDEVYDTGRDRGFGGELRGLARELGLAERVHFLGFRADVEELLGDLDALVHASVRPEPFGRVMIEGMAAGVPVVAARDGGVLEIIQDEQDGLLHTPGDVADLARQIERVLRDAALARRLRDQGARTVRDRFSLDAHARGVLAAYAEAIPGLAAGMAKTRE